MRRNELAFVWKVGKINVTFRAFLEKRNVTAWKAMLMFYSFLGGQKWERWESEANEKGERKKRRKKMESLFKTWNEKLLKKWGILEVSRLKDKRCKMEKETDMDVGRQTENEWVSERERKREREREIARQGSLLNKIKRSNCDRKAEWTERDWMKQKSWTEAAERIRMRWGWMRGWKVFNPEWRKGIPSAVSTFWG